MVVGQVIEGEGLALAAADRQENLEGLVGRSRERAQSPVNEAITLRAVT